MADFIDEVKQEMEYEKYQQFFINNGGKLITLAVIIVVATAAYTIYQKQQLKKARATGTMFVDAFADTKPENYDPIIAKAHKGFTPLAGLMKAGLLNSEDKYDDATKALQGVSGNYLYDRAFRDMAMIDEAYVMIEQKEKKEDILAKLETPSKPDAPFHATALELKASYLLDNGDKAAAKEIYTQLANDKTLAATMQDRAKHMLAVIGD